MKKYHYYYDTNVFWRFFIEVYIKNKKLPEKLIRYSPLELDTNIARITAPWTLDEFFHNYFKSEKDLSFPMFKNRIAEHVEILSKTKEFLAFFMQENMETRRINELFITLFLFAMNNNILSVKKYNKKINSKDLLHLSYALNSECHSFLTCDRGFMKIEKVKDIMDRIRAHKLKQIVIIEDDLSGIIKEINCSV